MNADDRVQHIPDVHIVFTKPVEIFAFLSIEHAAVRDILEMPRLL